MSTESIAIIGAIATVLAGFGGATLGACFAYKTGMKLVQETHKNATELLHRQEFIRASIQFRSAFFDLLIYCQQMPSSSGGEPHLIDFIITTIGEHTKATLLFRAYLTPINRSRFDQAWKDYSRQENWNQFNPKTIKSEYETVFYDIAEETKKCHVVISRIDKLFQFAPLEI